MDTRHKGRIASSLVTCGLSLCALSSAAQSNATTGLLPVVPLPVEFHFATGEPFCITPSTVIVCEAGSKDAAARTVEAVRRFTDRTLKTATDARARDNIVLRVDTQLFSELPDWQRAESYRLAVTSSLIELTAPSQHGLFNGAQTLAQLLAPTAKNQW